MMTAPTLRQRSSAAAAVAATWVLLVLLVPSASALVTTRQQQHHQRRQEQQQQQWGGPLIPSTFILPSVTHSRHSSYSATTSSSSLSSTMSNKKTSLGSYFPLSAVSKRQVAIYDGAELASILAFLKMESSNEDAAIDSSGVGYMSIIAGTTAEDSKRVVGIECPPESSSSTTTTTMSMGEGITLYQDSVAYIPQDVSDMDAISTMAAASASVHCGTPRVESVGGSTDGLVSGKAVVLGGGEYACFAAQGMAALGADVSLVTTRNVRVKDERVNVMGPAVNDKGFASVIGDFDSLVDTVSDEAKLDKPSVIGSTKQSYFGSGGVIDELRRQHKCSRYISTVSKSQKIVSNDGVIFGPKKADTHITNIVKTFLSSTNNAPKKKDYYQLVPPKNYGSSTVQKLLNDKVLFASKQNSKKSGEDAVLSRGWTLQEFWEQASWPRDSSGGGNVRFGLPVMDDDDEDEEDEDEVEAEFKKMVSAPPSIKEKFDRDEAKAKGIMRSSRRSQKTEVVVEEEDEEEETGVGGNPFVVDVVGTDGLESHIISTKADCVLFLSASYCKTCKKLRPQFNRMARIFQEEQAQNNNGGVTFAKADTGGTIGKALGRELRVYAVPAFVMFREGERYGSAIYATKLPSKRLDLAVEFLTQGLEWNITQIREAEQ